jgi:hypothetical protein
MFMISIPVATPSRSYEVLIGADCSPAPENPSARFWKTAARLW